MVGRGSAVRPYPCYTVPPRKIQPRNSGLARPELRNMGTPSNRSPPNCARFTRSIYGLDEFSSYPKLSHANLTPTPVPQESQPLRGCSAARRGVKNRVFDCKNRGALSNRERSNRESFSRLHLFNALKIRQGVHRRTNRRRIPRQRRRPKCWILP